MRLSKYVIALFVITVVSGIVMVSLLGISRTLKIDKNGFERGIRYTLQEQSRVDLGSQGYYFSGSTSSELYLGSSVTPLELLTMNRSTNGVTRSTLLGLNDLKLYWQTAKMQIDSPRILITEGMTPKVVKGSIKDRRMEVVSDSIPRFLASVPIDDSRYIIKSYSQKLQKSILKKIDFSKVKEDVVYALEPQIDGMFCSDGTLSFDKLNHQIIYTFRYRNQFICLDTNLNLRFKANTIDTNFHAKLKIVEVKPGERVLASPPVPVNKLTSISGKKLYILSPLRADNDSRMTFEKTAAIDSYFLGDGRYLNSFYIPTVVGEDGLDSFSVFDNMLYAIYNKTMIVYKLIDKTR